ncbi:MAG: DNA repair protein RecO [Patescibacteria group bacterium]|jgi:DNA repair protein RecO (recombination protein O)
MATYQVKGIILKKTDRGEADQLFSIYTDKKGKIFALGKGTKKIKSKLNSHLQQLAVVDLMVALGKNHDHVAGAQIFKKFSGIAGDFKKTILASYALELVEKMTKTGEPDPKIFVLLVKYLAVINGNSLANQDWPVIKQAFVIKLLSILGMAPPADIAGDRKKLEIFLNQHLEFPLQTEKFLVKMGRMRP